MVYLPLGKMMDFASWDDDDIPNWKVIEFIPCFQSPPSSMKNVKFSVAFNVRHSWNFDRPNFF